MNEPEEDKNALRAPIGISLVSAAGLIVVVAYASIVVPAEIPSQVLWAAAFWAAGSFLGFLFGIPKVLQGTQPPGIPPTAPSGTAPAAPERSGHTARSYHLRINTNFEEISDWITKIIIGTSLVELKEMPGRIDRLAARVVSRFPGSDYSGYGVAVIVLFSVLGFLFGYLFTRLYLQGRLASVEAKLSSMASLDYERRLQSATTAEEVLREVAKPDPSLAAREAVAPSTNVENRLRQLAEEYKAVAIRDWSLRVKEKNRLAAEMVRYMNEKGISRDWLAQRDDEGMILALAAAVHATPLEGDTDRLLKVARKVKRLHVRYRIVLAFSRLLEEGLVPANRRTGIVKILDEYRDGADDSLTRLITSVRNQFTTENAPVL